MKVQLPSNSLKKILNLSKADNISIIVKDKIYIVATDINDFHFKNQIVLTVDKSFGEEGQTLISRDVLKLIQKDAEVEITEDTIKVNERKIKYVANDLVQQPVKAENYLTTIQEGELQHLLSGSYAAADEGVRPVLNGICITGSNFVACDGFRLAIRTGTFEAKEDVIIDLNLVNVLKKIKNKGEISIYYNDKYIKFVFNDFEVIGNRIEGTYLNYKTIIPQEYTTRVENIETKAIVNTLKDYKKNKFKFVKLNFEIKKLTMSAENDNNTIEVKDEFKIENEGKVLKIAFNSDYLLDTLKDYSVATLELTTNISPLVFKSKNKLDLVLPIRIIDK